ncbi:MAG: cardiolipin synthase [Bacteroidetes bacterium 4572_77]|nr:MAG: cardiolipin synthase [Bacteroidetes bacterium 4572_77]
MIFLPNLLLHTVVETNSEIWNWLNILYVLFAYSLIIFLVLKTLLQNRNPIVTMSWIMVLILIPYFGLLIYFFFGQKTTKKWLYKRISAKEIQEMKKISQNQLHKVKEEKNLEDIYLNQYKKLISIQLKNNYSFLSSNNSIQLYYSGIELYKEIIEDLKKATSFIHLEYYLFENGIMADEIAEVLLEKQRLGLKISLIIDGIGSRKLSDTYINRLKNNGIEVIVFRPVRFPKLTNKINNRDHKKAIIIDGIVAYTGGINISDKYLIKEGEKGFWRDTHMRISGDSVKMIEAVFLVDRFQLTSYMPKDLSLFFPKINFPPASLIQIVANSPDNEKSSIINSFFIAINSAKSNIRLVSPYFIPNESLLIALKTVAQSGIKVEIIMPKHSDSAFVQNSAFSYVQELLNYRIQVYYYKKGFIHAKTLLIDNNLSILGTANFDYRSFYHNHEINTIIYNEEICAKLTQQFRQDKRDSEKVTSNRWRNRPIQNKVLESLARLIAPLM